MTKKIVLIILLLMLSLSHCKKEDSIEGVHIQEKNNVLNSIGFELVKSVRVEQEEVLLEVPFLYYDNTSHKIGVYGYKSPRMDVDINIFSTTLDFEKKIILKSGQGPGDVGAGTKIFPFKDKIIVTDNTLRRFSTFDKDFNFIRFETVRRFGMFIDNGNHFLSAGRDETDGNTTFESMIISYPGFKIKRLARFGPYGINYLVDSKNRGIHGKLPVFDYFYRNNEIFFFNLKDYTITKYTLAGKALKKIVVKHKTLKASEEMKKKWIREWMPGEWAVRNVTFVDIIQPAAAAIPLGKGFVVLRRKDYSMVCNRRFVEGDYFDYDLNLLGKVEFPCFYKAFCIATKPALTQHYENGYLYLIISNDEDHTLEKWKVNE